MINEEKDQHPWLTETALVTSLILTTASRITSLALFTSIFTWKVVLVVGFHCLVIFAEAYHSTAKQKVRVDFKSLLLTCYVSIFIYVCVEKQSYFGKFPWMYDILLITETTVVYMVWFLAGGNDTDYGGSAAAVVFGGYILGAIFKLNLFDYKRLSKYITLS